MPVAAGIAYAEHRGGPPVGRRPPLVLIHGAGTSRLVWPAQLRRLPRTRVYCLDLPGHGRAAGPGEASISGYTARLMAWMEAIALAQAVLVGHSMGGAIALQAGLDYPDRVAGLVILSSGGRLRVDPALLAGLADPSTARATMDQINLRWFSPRTPAPILRLSRERLAEIPPQVLLDDLRACDGFDVLDRLSEIAAPALILCGLEDQMTPEKYSRYLAYQISRAHLEFVPEAGHMILLEQPEALAQAVERFLAKSLDS